MHVPKKLGDADVEAQMSPASGQGEPGSVEIATLDLRLAELRLTSPTAYARLKVGIEREGLRQPLLVSDLVEAGRLVLVDGFKRLGVLKELGHKSVPVCVVQLQAAQAEAAIVTSNAAKPGLSDLEEALVIRSLHRSHGLSQVEIGVLLNRHKSWVCRRLRLLECLEPKVLQDVRIGLISTTAARELSRLPRGNQVETAQVSRGHRLTTRQVRRLVEILAGCDVDARRAVLARPLDHLADTQAGTAQLDARLSSLGNRLRQILLRFHSASNRLGELLLDHCQGSFTPTDLEVIGGMAPGILSKAGAVQNELEKFLGAA